MTLVETIIAAHAGSSQVQAGAIVTVGVDRIYAQDGNVPTLRRLFELNGFDRVFDRSRVHFVIDHSSLSPDRQMATRVKEAETFARQLGVELVVAGDGISHVVAAERGWYKPGDIVLGADSHTCSGGATYALSLGMGATDVAAAMVSGRTWLRVPETVVVEFAGSPRPSVSAKDIMLHVLGTFPPEAFLYRSIEWTGDWIRQCSDDEAATVANMSVELGAKCAFVDRPSNRAAIPGGFAGKRIVIEIDQMAPQIAGGHSIHAAADLDRYAGQRIDYVFIGSCANGRYDDIAAAADILRDRTVATACKLVVVPGSRDVYLRALRSGHIERIVSAGGMVSPPGCGPCVGAQGHVPADGDVVLSTMNRNFKGRMGNPNAEILLGSPRIAAAAAVLGYLPSEAQLKHLIRHAARDTCPC